jgi:AraC-like DNA-binding protein
MATDSAHGVSTSRTRVLESALGLVEVLQVAGPHTARPGAEGYSAEYQVCLPCRGAFVWHVGRDEVVADPNGVLFVTGDEAFRVSRPVSGGFAELIVTVQPELLAEILGKAERRLDDHALFRRRSRPASPALQRLAIECLYQSPDRDGGLAADEWVLDFLRLSLESAGPAGMVSPSTRRLVDRAKAYLAANLGAPVRLEHVASAAGSSPTYLTTAFRRVEGRPVHRYLLQLRLARALVELPHASSLTTLACDLGFSNHSHFTALFRRTFGCTPSAYRESLRRDRARVTALVRGSGATIDARASSRPNP